MVLIKINNFQVLLQHPVCLLATVCPTMMIMD
ncbi:hypothetical protein LEMLEM_LOCUS25142 [Lemmus lemmus]